MTASTLTYSLHRNATCAAGTMLMPRGGAQIGDFGDVTLAWRHAR